MRSSTSSSEAGARSAGARRPWRAAWLPFLVTLASLWLAGLWLSRDAGALAYARPGPARDELPPGDWYVDYGLDGHSISYEILLHGLGPSIENARAADVLIVGNSRALFGFPHPVLASFAAEHDLSIFHLGFGFFESQVMPLRVIRAHDLRPRLVVVNADCFFDERVSDIGRTVLPTSGWDALAKGIEARGEYLYRTSLRPRVPHFTPRVPIPWRWGEPDAWAILRSTENGSWLPWHWPDLKLFCDPRVGRGVPWFWSNVARPVPRTPSAPLPPSRVAVARAFQAELERRGARLVLTFVPARLVLCPREHAAELARELDVPFLAPRSALLTTSDGSHLSPESGVWFAETFFDELAAAPVFREAFPR